MSILNQFIPLIISRMSEAESPELKSSIQDFLKQLDIDMDDNGFVPGTEITNCATKIDEALIHLDVVETDDSDEDDVEYETIGDIRKEDLDDEDEDEVIRQRSTDDDD